jgi:hypothetical protein
MHVWHTESSEFEDLGGHTSDSIVHGRRSQQLQQFYTHSLLSAALLLLRPTTPGPYDLFL